MTADCGSARGSGAAQGLALRLKIDACIGSACLQRAPVSQHQPGASAAGGLRGVRRGESVLRLIRLPALPAHGEDPLVAISALLTARLSPAFRCGLRRAGLQNAVGTRDVFAKAPTEVK